MSKTIAEPDADINDPSFAGLAAQTLLDMIKSPGKHLHFGESKPSP